MIIILENDKAEGYGIHYWRNGYPTFNLLGDKYGNGTDLFHNGNSYVGQYKFGTLFDECKGIHVGTVNTFGVMEVCTLANS